MARDDLSMSPGELRGFLAGERWGVLGTLDADGSPFADAVACRLEGEWLYFRVPAQGRSARNLHRDPRVCCSFDRFPSYYQIRGATLHGLAEPVRDEALRARLAPALQAPPGSPVAGPAGGACEIHALPLDDAFGFDFGKVRNRL